MEDTPYKEILTNILKNGESGLDQLLVDASLENFYCDFKQCATRPTDSKLHNSDKENYVKAVSGFSNTSGGILVWGVAEKKGLFKKYPIESPEKFAAKLNHYTYTITQPALSAVNSFVVKSKQDPLQGFVITEIPKNYLSPVQVIADIHDLKHKYYIRSGSSFVTANHDIITGLYNRQRSSRLSYSWTEKETFQENESVITYFFGFNLQNKGVGVIRDIWINFNSSGFNIELEETKQINIFNKSDIFGQGISLITNDNYKCAPQGTIHPFLITLIIKKKSIPEDAWIYFSFGANQVAPKELKVSIKKDQLEAFILSEDRSTKAFLKLLGLGSGKSFPL